MAIAIIGASGFVGQRLCSRLSRAHSPYHMYDIECKGQVEFLDVVDRKSMSALEGCDSIINLAAEHRDDVVPVSKYYDVNVLGAQNICDAADQFGIKKIIFTSSVAVYGFTQGETNEKGDLNPFNEYGKSKLEAEQVYRSWYLKAPEDRTLVIIRPTVIFGEGNRGNVYNLLSSIASGKFVMIGSGQNVKSMAYVENVAAFIQHSLAFSKGTHTYNYADKPDLNMNQLVSLARSRLLNEKGVGLRVPVWLGVLGGYCCDVLAYVTQQNLPISSQRVRKFIGSTEFVGRTDATGFRPPVTLNEALLATIEAEF